MNHKFNFIRDGMIKLPPGFRFQPTDEELVFEYLKRKVLSWPLPASIIPEFHVFKSDPWDLPGDVEQERYFFSNEEAKYRNGNRINRATVSGYWKATGVDRQIGRNQVVGMKKKLVFYKGKPSNSSRTDWIMHEYRLVSLGNLVSNFPLSNSQKSFNYQLENWVVCKIFLKNRNMGSSSTEISNTNTVARFFDFMNKDEMESDSISCSSSCSSSSSITHEEVYSRGDDHDHEESSSTRNFF